MNARRRLILGLLAVPTLARAQGFAGLAADVDGFRQPARGTRFRFPQDHGAHPDFRIEWWYVTAVLTGEDGAQYGVQWTLFRNALRPGDGTGFSDPQVWMAHAAVSSADTHRYAEKLGRGGVGQAGVQADPFRAYLDTWEMAGPTLNDVKITAQGSDFSYDLALTTDRAPALHGDGGYSVKSTDGRASHYYSQPFYAASGTITLDGRTIPVRGNAWLDREWSSSPLAQNQTGWDWVSLYLDTGARVMGYRLRNAEGGDFTVGTWMRPGGRTIPLENGRITLTPGEKAEVAGRTIPVSWRVQVPSRGLDVTVAALNPQSWMGTRIPYWEGPVTMTGSHNGRGYLEMTGYE